MPITISGITHQHAHNVCYTLVSLISSVPLSYNVPFRYIIESLINNITTSTTSTTSAASHNTTPSLYTHREDTTNMLSSSAPDHGQPTTPLHLSSSSCGFQLDGEHDALIISSSQVNSPSLSLSPTYSLSSSTHSGTEDEQETRDDDDHPSALIILETPTQQTTAEHTSAFWSLLISPVTVSHQQQSSSQDTSSEETNDNLVQDKTKKERSSSSPHAEESSSVSLRSLSSSLPYSSECNTQDAACSGLLSSSVPAPHTHSFLVAQDRARRENKTVRQWLVFHQFDKTILQALSLYTCTDLLQLSRSDALDLCGIREGIRLFNKLQQIIHTEAGGIQTPSHNPSMILRHTDEDHSDSGFDTDVEPECDAYTEEESDECEAGAVVHPIAALSGVGGVTPPCTPPRRVYHGRYPSPAHSRSPLFSPLYHLPVCGVLPDGVYFDRFKYTTCGEACCGRRDVQVCSNKRCNRRVCQVHAAKSLWSGHVYCASCMGQSFGCVIS